jgi:hypothetical protein
VRPNRGSPHNGASNERGRSAGRAPALDAWLPDPAVRVAHRRASPAPPESLWAAARSVRLRDTRVLGRLVRWRIPGLPREGTYDEIFRSPPFVPLEEHPHALVSGLCGRIWTLARDYPTLADPEEFRRWGEPGTARVLFANWVQPEAGGGAVIVSETRVAAVDREGRLGLLAVRPLIAAFSNLIGGEALAVAVRLADRR